MLGVGLIGEDASALPRRPAQQFRLHLHLGPGRPLLLASSALPAGWRARPPPCWAWAGESLGPASSARPPAAPLGARPGRAAGRRDLPGPPRARRGVPSKPLRLQTNPDMEGDRALTTGRGPMRREPGWVESRSGASLTAGRRQGRGPSEGGGDRPDCPCSPLLRRCCDQVVLDMVAICVLAGAAHCARIIPI